jgi:hypothetical protein
MRVEQSGILFRSIEIVDGIGEADPLYRLECDRDTRESDLQPRFPAECSTMSESERFYVSLMNTRVDGVPEVQVRELLATGSHGNEFPKIAESNRYGTSTRSSNLGAMDENI